MQRLLQVLLLSGLIAAVSACGANVTVNVTTQQPAAQSNNNITISSAASCADVKDPAGVSVPANSNQQHWSAPGQVIDTTHQYCAILTTEHGRILLELYAQSAPKNVNNFVFLASNGFYDNTPFHRVIPGFMAQGGDPTGTGGGGPGYDNIPLEAANQTYKYDRPGVVGVARTSDPNSAGSQFFITFGPTTSLNNQYTIIGQVAGGMDVVNAIKVRNVDQDPNAASIVPEKLLTARIVDLGVHK